MAVDTKLCEGLPICPFFFARPLLSNSCENIQAVAVLRCVVYYGGSRFLSFHLTTWILVRVLSFVIVNQIKIILGPLATCVPFV